MRVVLDSNIYVSALTLPGGKADQALSLVLSGRVTAMLSKPILEEVLNVLGRKFARDTEELSRTALLLTELGMMVVSARKIKQLADEPDNRILECAVSGNVKYIVTGDKPMLALKIFEGIEIITLREFLQSTSSIG